MGFTFKYFIKKGFVIKNSYTSRVIQGWGLNYSMFPLVLQFISFIFVKMGFLEINYTVIFKWGRLEEVVKSFQFFELFASPNIIGKDKETFLANDVHFRVVGARICFYVI